MNDEMKDIGFARLDLSRPERTGVAETIYCPGKTPEQLVRILEAFRERGRAVLGSRCTEQQFLHAQGHGLPVSYDATSRTLLLAGTPHPAQPGLLAVCTGGTADMPVAEEAARTAEFFGARVERFYDVGYGACFQGLAPLLSMLNSCAEGLSVVNIDNGFGAAVQACRILNMIRKHER